MKLKGNTNFIVIALCRWHMLRNTACVNCCRRLLALERIEGGCFSFFVPGYYHPKEIISVAFALWDGSRADVSDLKYQDDIISKISRNKLHNFPELSKHNECGNNSEIQVFSSKGMKESFFINLVLFFNWLHCNRDKSHYYVPSIQHVKSARKIRANLPKRQISH